jgi:hypothetical protein
MRLLRPSRFGLGAGGGLLAFSLALTGCGGMNTSADPATQADNDSAANDHAGMDDMDSGDAGSGDHGDDGHSHESEGDGLASTLQGISLADVETDATSDKAGKLTFHVELENGATASSFESDRGKSMHLYLVTKDLGTYRHLHPTRDALGNWTADVPPLPGGPLHVVTSFIANDAAGESHALTLGADIAIDGASPNAVELPAPAARTKVDGYTVTLADGLAAGVEAKLNLTITKEGKPAALEPYLDSWSHTSVFSSSSLAHAHLHPAQEWKEGAEPPEILTFVWTPPAAGTYRFFIEFMADGKLHRADFTRSVDG